MRTTAKSTEHLPIKSSPGCIPPDSSSNSAAALNMHLSEQCRNREEPRSWDLILDKAGAHAGGLSPNISIPPFGVSTPGKVGDHGKAKPA